MKSSNFRQKPKICFKSLSSHIIFRIAYNKLKTTYTKFALYALNTHSSVADEYLTVFLTIWQKTWKLIERARNGIFGDTEAPDFEPCYFEQVFSID